MLEIAIIGDENSISRFQASARLFNLIAPQIWGKNSNIQNLYFAARSREADVIAFLYDSCVTETQSFCTDHCVLLLGEPPEIVPHYPRAWTTQFDIVVGPRPEMILHDNFSLETILPWGFESEHLIAPPRRYDLRRSLKGSTKPTWATDPTACPCYAQIN